MLTILTRDNLREQTHDSRLRNIEGEIIRQIEMQFLDPSHPAIRPTDRLSHLGLLGTTAERMAKILQRIFPFITEDAARAAIITAPTVRALSEMILAKVGA